MKEVTVIADDELILKPEMLQEAGLHGRLRVLISSGEIRILPLLPATPEELVQELAGCLGQEPASAYDFDLKLGGLRGRMFRMLDASVLRRRKSALRAVSVARRCDSV